MLMAFLRMELHAHDVSSLNGRDKLMAIGGGPQHLGLILSDEIVGVNEVEAGLRIQFATEKAIGMSWLHDVPSHVRHAQASIFTVGSKAPTFGINPAKAWLAALFACGAEQLNAKTNSED